MSLDDSDYGMFAKHLDRLEEQLERIADVLAETAGSLSVLPTGSIVHTIDPATGITITTPAIALTLGVDGTYALTPDGTFITLDAFHILTLTASTEETNR